VNNNCEPSDDIEDLMQHVKSQYHQNQQQSDYKTTPKSEVNPLDQIKQNYQKAQPTHAPQSTQANELDDIAIQYQNLRTQYKKNTPRPKTEAPQQLKQLKQNYQHQKQGSQHYSPRQNLDEIRLAEQRQQQQKKQAIAQANQWLNQLEPYSEEGMWFEQFAGSYPSRLDAAIDYLRALKG
jgi:hypothetical protein